MENINSKISKKNENLPIKVLMFGEGNFLRAFAAFIIQKLNDNGHYSGSIQVIQGLKEGRGDEINKQNGLYNVIERGIENGNLTERFSLITCLNNCHNPYSDYDGYLEFAENPDLEVIISNTTEFGICYSENEYKEKKVRENFPAKLTDLLYRRYMFFNADIDKGFVILPCELIEKNAEKLKELVIRYASEWDLGEDFKSWVLNANIFADTLVDRIVSGYPQKEADSIHEKLGYEDKLLDVCEPFLLWVIEGDKKILNKIPLDKSGLPIIITDDLEKYRTRKVRILNGAHTMSVLAGYLCGFEFVEQLVKDNVFNSFIKKGIFEEIIPAMQGDMLDEYANDVLERFENPYLNHRLIGISLNSVSKLKSRVIVSIKDYILKFKIPPKILSFSIAAFIAFYEQGINSYVADENEYVEKFKEIFKISDCNKKLINLILSEKSFWGEDLTALNGFENVVLKHYVSIKNKGIKQTIEELINE